MIIPSSVEYNLQFFTFHVLFPERTLRMNFQFEFPFKPYDCQAMLMSELYQCFVDNIRVAFVESPTGTGKSLSLFVSCAAWLVRNRHFRSSDDQVNDSEPQWVLEQTRELEQQRFCELTAELRREQSKRAQILKKRPNDNVAAFPRRLNFLDLPVDLPTDESLLLEGYTEDEDIMKRLKSEGQNAKLTIEALRDSLPRRKIIYCSRTHSQLSQVAKEMQFCIDHAPSSSPLRSLKIVSLGSRKELCINTAVKNTYRNTSSINDGCQDLHDRVKSGKKGSPFLNYDAIEYEALTFNVNNEKKNVLDIEECNTVGSRSSICPYYLSREAAKDADIILIPYQSLLSASSREALGIDLKENILVIDEGHNLIEAALDNGKRRISCDDVRLFETLLSEYCARYRKRIRPVTFVTVEKLLKCIRKLYSWASTASRPEDGVRRVDSQEMLFELGLDNMNFFELIQFVKSTRMAQKLRGMARLLAKQQLSNPREHSSESMRSPCHEVTAFLVTLIDSSMEYQLLLEWAAEETLPTLSIVPVSLLDKFEKLALQTKTTIIAGGTIRPIEDIKTRLLPNIASDINAIRIISCSHIINDKNFQAFTLSHGPTRKRLNFSLKERRHDKEMVLETGRTLVNIFRMLNGGVLVFFPSYALLEEAFTIWTSEGLLQSLRSKKPVFVDSPRVNQQIFRQQSFKNEDIFARYKEACTRPEGAALFSVIGGSLSEGVNFKDELARAVVIVGMPYPNIADPVFKARLEHYEKQAANQKGVDCLDAKSRMMSGLCMRAVNQTIGRVIRHKDDYGVAILIDERDKTSSLRDFGEIVKNLRTFFSNRKRDM